MTVFAYEARDASGRLKTGTAEAEDPQALASRLRGTGLYPVRIYAKDDAYGSAENDFGHGSGSALWRRLRETGTLSLRRKALFYRELSLFISAGIPLGSALRRLASSEPYLPLRRKVAQLGACVDSGQKLSAGVRSTGLGTEADGAALEIGEESGDLGRALELVAQEYEKKEQLHSRIMTALTYPAFVTASSLCVLFVTGRHVLPRFYQSFQRMKIPVPLITRKVFAVSSQMDLWAGSLLLGCVGLWSLVRLARKSNAARLLADRVILKLPVVGSLLKKASLLQGLRSLGTLLQAGVPLIRAFDITVSSLNNAAAAEAFCLLRDRAVRGDSLGSCAQARPFFQPIAAQFISLGEQTGHLDQALLQAARWYEGDLEEAVRRLSSSSEAVLILAVGGLTALVVFAVFAPVLQGIRAFSGAFLP